MATNSSACCIFTEGRITLPDGYRDRTVNALVPEKEGEPAFTVARDSLEAGESRSDYIERQLTLMSQHLKGWKTLARDAIWLGSHLLEGETISASYLREGRRMWQQQAVFALDNAQILVFTLSKTAPLSATDASQLNALLGSFTFNS
ncbi:hypothetical protein PEC302107_30620 [Pectobacterium araliae]|uniref:DUF1795 domain-containing protein n=1 Tax=Pectobacterium araliae TaxID=3073862 RepID=A0AAN0MNQ1_9GAMM|nr:DUF1795 domain-containing protein [Pectobacterium sp. MAFF 302110]GKW21333.1 hypothetical protein PEC302107_30620 [Pectobacterium carotovorum subsp. carotovorum]